MVLSDNCDGVFTGREPHTTIKKVDKKTEASFEEFERMANNPEVRVVTNRMANQKIWLNSLLAFSPTGGLWLASRQNRWDYLIASTICQIPAAVLALMFVNGQVQLSPAKYAKPLGGLTAAAYVVPNLIKTKRNCKNLDKIFESYSESKS